MPIYGYECEKCHKTIEIFQNVNDKPITVCPDCGGKTRRIFYPVGIIFKGPGFHITDYCRPKESKGEKTKTPPKKKESKKTAESPKKDEKAS